MIYNRPVTESVSSETDLGHDKEELKPNSTGFEAIRISDYLGYDPELGVARNEELQEDPAYGNFFRNPVVMEAFTEHFDLTDRSTRKTLLSLNEAEQASVLTALTSKLYDHIVAKVDDIDYGEIPSTKGDVTKLSNYAKLRECINLLHDILKEYRQDTAPIDEIALALANIEARKDLFNRAFRMNVELPIIVYNNIVLSIINGVSYMIATSIEFIKTPNKDSFDMVLDKVAYAKTKSHLLYGNLKRFNKCCEKNEFDNAINHIIDEFVNIHESAAMAGAEIISGKLSTGATKLAAKLGVKSLKDVSFKTIMKYGAGKAIGAFKAASLGGKVIAVIGTIIAIVFLLRQLIYLFYYTKMRVSEFFDIQADLLEMDAQNIENNNSMEQSKKEKIASRQYKIVDLFRKMANKISINGRKAEVEATKEIESNDKKLTIKDIEDDLPDGVSVLF